MLSILISIFGILLTIFFVVGIHEFGHFIVARLVGIKVLRFSIGFGKVLFRRKDKKGTEYVISALPFGGYVKMLDETEGNVTPGELHLAYNRQPLLSRVAVIIAGPIFNIIFSFFLYWLLFIIGFNTIIPLVGKVTPHSIASTAGIKPQEQILKVDNVTTPSWTQVILQVMEYVGNKNQLSVTTQNIHTKINMRKINPKRYKSNCAL